MSALAEGSPRGPGAEPRAAGPVGPPVPGELRAQDAVWVVRRNWPLIAACTLLALAAAVLFLGRSTPLYRASASLLVDAAQTPLQPLERGAARRPPPDVETEIEALRSRELVAATVRALGLQVAVVEPAATPRQAVLGRVEVGPNAAEGRYRIAPQPGGRVAVSDAAGPRALGSFPAGAPIPLAPGVTVTLAPGAAERGPVVLAVEDLDVATAGVEEALRVTRPNENAGVIRIQFEAADPRVTRDVPNALADAYLARRRAAQTTEARSSARFLAEQLDTARRQLAAAEDTLRGFREREGVVDPAAEASTGITRRSELQAQRTALEAERRSLGAILTDVRARAASGDPAVPSPYRRLVGFPSFVRNPAAAELLRSITAVEDQRALLLQRRTLEDPSVQVLTARVAQLEDQLRGVVVTYYEGLAGQVGALDAALSRSAQQLSRLPGREAEFERLRRRPTTLADVYGLLQTRLKEAQIAEAVEDASVRVVDRATLPRRPVKPNKALVLGLAGVLGLAAGVVLAFLRTQLVPVVHSREDVRRLVGLPVLGVVPRARGHAAAATAADGVAAEAYRRLRTNVLAAAQPDGGPAILLVTSPSPAEGKTTVAVNVAAAIARQGSRVLLADADLRHGELTERLLPASGAAVRPTGLAGVLQAGDDAALPAVGRPVDVGGAQLDLLAAGRAPAAPADLLAAPAMRRLIERLRASYDVVVIDSPAVNAVADAAVLAGAVDGVLLVVRSGRTRLSAITAALEQLAAVGAPVLGIVLNGGDAEDGGAGARRLGRRR